MSKRNLNILLLVAAVAVISFLAIGYYGRHNELVEQEARQNG